MIPRVSTLFNKIVAKSYRYRYDLTDETVSLRIWFMETLFTLKQAALAGRLGAVALRKRCEKGEAGRQYGGVWLLTLEEVNRLQGEGYRKPGRPRKAETVSPALQ